MSTMAIEQTTPSTLDALSAQPQSGLPSTSQLLTEGGDTRILADPGHGRNKYGCQPFPDPEMVAFGSSTASIISSDGFAAADRLRKQLLLTTRAESRADTYARELERIRRKLLTLSGVADIPDLDVVFAASGTDLHLITAQLASSAEPLPTLVLMVDPTETGSGVSAALAGRHFSSCSALGEPVDAGEEIAGGTAIEVVSVPMRNEDGPLRPTAEIDAEVEALASQAVNSGRRVVLVLVDSSKTGCIAPSPGCALRLQRKLAGRIDILVDACQFRIAPSTLRAYLQNDCMVALTGSKFLTGPTFSGALLIPAPTAQRLRRLPLPPALQAYSARADWPQHWVAAQALDHVANFGLLLRWEAALHELAAFRAVPEAKVIQFLKAFASAVENKLRGNPLLELLPRPELDRRPLIAATSWDHIPTIFPFLMFHPESAGKKLPLSREQTQHVYQLLQADLSNRQDLGVTQADADIAKLRCQLGQPVACANRDGIPVSALRVCASARLVVEATANNGENAAAVIERAVATLEKSAILARAASLTC